MNKKKPRILLLSSIQPELTHGGPVILHRHLIEQHDFDLFCLGPANAAKDWWPIELFMGRLRHSRFSTLSTYYEQTWRHRRLSCTMRKQIQQFDPEVVLTVAHGNMYWLAHKVARSMGLPLIGMFHDWWPYLLEKRGCLSARGLQKTERAFIQFYQSCDCTMPVCKGMAEELGPHPNMILLPPLPPKKVPDLLPMPGERTGKIVYVGNMSSGYGKMLQRLLSSECDVRTAIRLFGSCSDWPEHVVDTLLAEGIISRERISDEGLAPYLHTALALLVTLPFDDAPPIARRTSFPSKLVSYLQYGRPIVFWGANDSSLIHWAKAHDAIGVFTDPDPTLVLAFLRRLKLTPQLQQEMCQEARRLGGLFDASQIHKRFKDAVVGTIAKFHGAARSSGFNS